MLKPKMRRIRIAGMTALLLVAAPLCGWAQNDARTTSEGQAAADANPLGMALVHQHAESFEPGKPFEVTVTVTAATAGKITAMGLRETLPPEWKLTAVAAGNGAPPDVSPTPGTAGVLEFAWITIPQFPYTFSYVATPPEGDGGAKDIQGALEYRETGGAHVAPQIMTEVRGPELKPPTITLKGDNPVTVHVGDTWQEPGYVAVDRKNQDITGKVSIIGNIDTSRPGEYRLNYAVETEEGLNTSVGRVIVVKGEGESQTNATAGTPTAVGGTAPPEPGASGREKSNPIAASVDKNPENQAQEAPPVAANSEGEGETAVKKPELPDLSEFRPPATPDAADPAASPSGAASATPSASPAPEVPIAPVPHRATVPKEMLKAAETKGPEQQAAVPPPSASESAAASASKSSSLFVMDESMKIMIGAIAVAVVLVGGLGFAGWRLVYSRPIQRKRPPKPPAR